MSFLKPEHQERIADAYHAFSDQAGFAHVAPLDEIRVNDGNLSIPMYVRRRGELKDQGVCAADELTEVVNVWEQSSKDLVKSIDNIFKILESIK